MEWTRPLAAIVSIGVLVWTLGAAYYLYDGLVVQANRRALVALAVVAVAVAAAILVGRRSRRWTDNPDHYW